MEQKLKALSRENLLEVIGKMAELLSEEQRQELDAMVEGYVPAEGEFEKTPIPARMSQEFVDEKMEQLESWMHQIDMGKIYLDVEEYEDYSRGYWDKEWVTNYYDNQGVGSKITALIQFAKDCVDDRRYQEAHRIYEWLWDMCVQTVCEYFDESDPADLETLSENDVIRTDMKELALLTLYTDYQVQEAENRAEDLYLYFSFFTFQKLHIEEMFHAGRESLTGTEQFWTDWIELLKTKKGDMAARLLQEAVLQHEGAEGLLKMADENAKEHPSLYLAAMEQCEKTHDYDKIEEIGERALGKLDTTLIIRSETALKAAYASSCLMHTEKMMLFCWESFRSDSTVRNFLRLFGMKEMAEKYGTRGNEVLDARIPGEPIGSVNRELIQNLMSDHTYYELCFYTGNFEKVKKVSKNPQGSLGWSGRFIRCGIKLFLLYLYEKPLPSKAATMIAREIGFWDDKEPHCLLKFESEIIEESRKHETSVFWNYFQRWKTYFPMDREERKRYLDWAEKIVYKRADAIVGGQHRSHYANVAGLLAITAEIKEDMGESGAMREIYAEYKRKFPRHSSFQAEMKFYFGK